MFLLKERGEPSGRGLPDCSSYIIVHPTFIALLYINTVTLSLLKERESEGGPGDTHSSIIPVERERE